MNEMDKMMNDGVQVRRVKDQIRNERQFSQPPIGPVCEYIFMSDDCSVSVDFDKMK